MTDRDEVIVYHFDRDLEQVLHNIVNAWNRNKDYKKRWNINPKEEFWVNIKLQGDILELRVETLKGGWRQSHLDVQEMAKFAKEIKACQKSAESDLRKEFKQKTGKSFKWSKCKEYSNYEPVALNNLYKFYATKIGPVTVELDRQEFSKDGPELNISKKDKKDKEDSWKLTDILDLPEKWR